MLFIIWDSVNERYVRDLWDDTQRFKTRETAEDYAKKLNAFGGYGGMVSARYTVRQWDGKPSGIIHNLS